ncbi:hypothetical protein VII00023_20572 [Vibrio ichthyoenteri ATCC 700023]|uniref:Uncharacterized protein n=1 Tax=Vibrio ichthyoenteri ATCC 700023 TaxID=870968 RepID=F9S7S7_9VIBR|nr:hypothetical protein VII00023_20572 [Vibrio ichthyoenteri ATCC 700023]
MKLNECPECGELYLDKSKECCHCGAEFGSRNHKTKVAVLIAILLVIGVFLSTQSVG